MDIDYPLRNLLFYGLIVFTFWFSWKLAVKVIKKKGFWMAVLVSVLSSAFILAPGGYYWYLTDPDLIGKGIVVFIYNIAFFIINAVNILRFGFNKKET